MVIRTVMNITDMAVTATVMTIPTLMIISRWPWRASA